uniref:Macrophage migration inhibitory factor n=1 Tax=Panagrolaimus sp. PS1159 TaxID=55785 RepID=A0AC35GV32_9BILA
MPVLIITTNLDKIAVTKNEAILDLSKVTAKVSGKPEAYISVVINTTTFMSFGGTLEPAALIEFSTVEEFSVDKDVINELSEAVCKNIGVSNDRFFIKFNIMNPNHIAYDGKTIADFIKDLQQQK